MKGKTTIEAIFGTKKEVMIAKFNEVMLHSVSKGDESENEWIVFLESFLPNRYKVSKGYVFDSKGNVSDQIDIIIYDALYSPLITKKSNGETYVTVESVYAIFEVKPTINKTNLKYAHDKVQSVLNLHRTSRQIDNAGQIVEAKKLTDILGGILTYDSCKIITLKKHLEAYKNIHLGCAINDLAFVSYKNKEKEIDLRTIQTDEIIMSFYFIILELLTLQGTVAAIDIRDYCKLIIPKFELW